MYISKKQIPYHLFHQIGFSKKQVLDLAPEDLKALLSGRTTSKLPLHIKSNGLDFQTEAKLSLYYLPDNSVGLKVHPLRAEIQNDFNFNQYQLESLKQGNLIRADHLSLNGQKETYLFQLDPEINEIQRIRVTDIQFPASILGQELSSPHKEQLLQGKVVEVFSPRDQQLHLVRLDLLDSKGFGVDHPQYVQELTTLKVEDQKIVLGKDQSGTFYQSQTQDPLVWNPQITSQLKQMIEQHEIMVPVKPIQPADEKMYYARDLEGNYYQTADKHVFDTGKKSDWEPLDQQKGRLLEYGHNFSKEQLLTKELSVDRFTDRGADQPVRTIKR